MPRTRIAGSALRVGTVTALLLLVLAVAVQFTDEVVWGPGDFAAAAVLLFSAGMVYMLGSRRAGSTRHRIALGLITAGALAIVWAELAVGILG